MGATGVPGVPGVPTMTEPRASETGGVLEPARDDFYVGYLGLPKRHALFLGVALPLALGAIGAGVIGLSAGQPGWGDAVWDTAEPIEVTGVFRAEPYPMVHEVTEQGVRSHLLVQVGKLGTSAHFADESRAYLDGAVVTVTGWRLERDGRRMLELDLFGAFSGEGHEAIRVVEDAPGVRDSVDLTGAEPVTLVGEVVDAKCFLGAMKPGRGRGHKACATLCVEGGIPPMVYSLDAEGRPRYHLVVDETGGPLSGERLDRVLPLIAEPVRVSGVESRVGSWRVIRTTLGAVEGL